MSDLRIDGERLWGSLMELAQIGATPKGGVARLALTDLDREGRDWLVARAREAGMAVTVDRIGNVFMRPRRPESRPSRRDGGLAHRHAAHRREVRRQLWLLAGLEVIRTLGDHVSSPRRRWKLPRGPTRKDRASCR
jgi:N-carbamoyl-L-amino-acid hydrolase